MGEEKREEAGQWSRQSRDERKAARLSRRHKRGERIDKRTLVTRSKSRERRGMRRRLEHAEDVYLVQWRWAVVNPSERKKKERKGEKKGTGTSCKGGQR